MDAAEISLRQESAGGLRRPFQDKSCPSRRKVRVSLHESLQGQPQSFRQRLDVLIGDAHIPGHAATRPAPPATKLLRLRFHKRRCHYSENTPACAPPHAAAHAITLKHPPKEKRLTATNQSAILLRMSQKFFYFSFYFGRPRAARTIR